MRLSDGPGPREVSFRVKEREKKNRKLIYRVQSGTLRPLTPQNGTAVSNTRPPGCACF